MAPDVCLEFVLRWLVRGWDCSPTGSAGGHDDCSQYYCISCEREESSERAGRPLAALHIIGRVRMVVIDVVTRRRVNGRRRIGLNMLY